MISITRRRWFRASALLFFLTFAFVQLFAMARAPLPREQYERFIVQDLVVEDLPDDDGSGLLLSWKPLGIEARVIEYRVYRGSTEDKLFFVGSIPVNPKTGFAGQKVMYYDSGYNLMININSPRKLRREVQQYEDSPLFRQLPKDLSVVEPKLESYNLLGVIPKKEFYYRTQKIEIPAEDEEGDSSFFAGIHTRQLHPGQILSSLKPDTPYYYTVLAVNEQRRFYPYADIVKGIPRINSPEKPRIIYPVYVEDIERIQFEWVWALTTSGIGRVSVYMMNESDLNTFREYVNQLELNDTNRLKRLENPDIEPYNVTASNPAKAIVRNAYHPSANNMNTASFDLQEGKLYDSDNNVIFDKNRDDIGNYLAVLSFTNYWGMETFGTPVAFNQVQKEDLPTSPVFAVTDKPNDKGDANTIYWDKPVVFLTGASFLNRQRTRLLVSYEFETNKQYKIDNIYFEIYDDEDNLIASVNEFYQNLFFKITLPQQYSYNPLLPEDQAYDMSRPIKFKMNFRVSENELPEDYYFTQNLLFDNDYMSYRPDALEMHGEKVANYFYVLYKNQYSGETFRLSSRAAGILREVDDTIRYETNIFKPILNVLPDRNMFLVETNINSFYDKEERRPINTHIYYSLVERDIDNLQNQINELTVNLSDAETEAERMEMQNSIDRYEAMLATHRHELLQEANEQSNDRARMRIISRAREQEMRTFQYKMVKTDGRGLFIETDAYADADGNIYFYPVPNWFNTTRTATLIASFIFGFLVFYMIRRAKQGKDMYVRPIAGLEEIDNAIGRATEMGRPILFQPGLDGIGSVATLAGLNILGKVAKKAAEYDTKILVPCRDYIVMPIAQEIVKEAHYEAGRPDTFDKNSVFFITTQQFAFVAGVNGIMVREKCATCFYMGMYYAEALIMTEVGNTIGAVQIAGTDAVTQVPFFITTCDFTLIGEELYGASAYLSREPMMMGTLKAVDVAKAIILVCMITGAFLSTIQQTFFIQMFPDQ